MTTAFTETLNLCIDYHDDSLTVGPIADPHHHFPPAGRTAAVLRLLTDAELRLTTYQFDAVVPVTDGEQLWDAITANLEWVLWKTPAMWNMDCERLIAKGLVSTSDSLASVSEHISVRRAA